MSHELRTSLNAIIGYSEILIEDLETIGDNADSVADLRKIREAGTHLLGLIGSILDISKIEAGKMDLYLETFDLAGHVRAVSDMVRPLMIRNGNVFTCDCPEDIGNLHADQTKVRQILFNLLSNAAKFTQEGEVALRVPTSRWLKPSGRCWPA